MAVLGEPTEKIVDLFRTRMNYKGLLVKFKLQAGITEDELLGHRRAKPPHQRCELHCGQHTGNGPRPGAGRVDCGREFPPARDAHGTGKSAL